MMAAAPTSDLSRPLRVLCVIANPTDAPHFDDARVREELSESLNSFTSQGAMDLQYLADPTENALRHELARNAWQVLHLIAHAQERRDVHRASVGLQSADGRTRNLTATYLADLLSSAPLLKMVVLQGCDESCSFDVAAETLREKNISAVTLPSCGGRAARSAIESLYAGLIADLFPGELKNARSSISTEIPGEPVRAAEPRATRATLSAPPSAPAPVDSGSPLQVFYSYAHEDEDLRKALEKHLSLLQRSGLIESWHDRRISAGDEWEDEINEHVRSAQVILLLISADFLASDYCYGTELKIALERHARREAIVVPIILRPVDWSSASFAYLQALPRDARPVTSWPDRDEALADVARGIRVMLSHVPGIRRGK